MKTKISRIGKKSLSVIIALMMIVSTMLVGIVSVNAANDPTKAEFYLVGQFTGSNWDKDKTKYKIENNYSGSNVIFYYDVEGTDLNGKWFAICNSSGSRYAPITSEAIGIGQSNKKSGTYNEINSWQYTGSATKIRICVDQRDSDSDNMYRPYVWVEEISESTKYTVSKGTETNGTFSVSSTSAAEGDTVTVTTSPSNGYEVDTVTYTPDGGSATTISGSNNTYTFTMPAAKVTVNVSFKATSTPSTTYYLTGRFGIKKDGKMTYLGGSLNYWVVDNTSNITFTQVSDSTLYKLETGQTIKELATNTGTSTWYFQISDGTTKYRPASGDDNGDSSLTISDNNTEFDTGTEKGSFYFTGDDETGNVTLYFDSSSNKFHFEVEGGTDTPGTLTSGTTVYVRSSTEISAATLSTTLNSSAQETDVAMSKAGDFNAKYYYSYPLTKDADNVTFTVTLKGATEAITKSAACVEGKNVYDVDNGTWSAYEIDKTKAYSSGLWVDVQPSVTNTTLALIKWSNQFGSSGTLSQTDGYDTYHLYIPSGVTLSTLPIYSKFSSLTINGTTVANGEAYSSLTAGTTYTVVGDGTTYKLKVFQSDASAIYTYTSEDLYTTTKSDTKKPSYSNGSFMTANADGSINDNLQTLVQLKGRGNSSWESSCTKFGKYAYNIKLNSKIDPLDMGATKAKSFCMLANNMDEAQLRNLMTYQMGIDADIPFTPHFKAVDWYNNGTYLGSYLITEKVDVGSSKLVKGTTVEDYHDYDPDAVDSSSEQTYNITTSTGNTFTGKYVYVDTGSYTPGTNESSDAYKNKSYLLEFDLKSRATAERSWFVTPKGQYIAVKSYEDLSQEEMLFIIEKWCEAENAVYNGDYTTANSLMDLDSFAQVYLVQELSKNLDSCATSYYVYYDGTQDNPKWQATPLWDYDWAYGIYTKGNEKPINTSGDKATQDLTSTEKWFAKYKYITLEGTDSVDNRYNLQAQLCTMTDFWDTNVKGVWNGGFYQSAVSAFGKYNSSSDITSGKIDTVYNSINDSIAMNEARYGFVANCPITDWGSAGSNKTPDAAYSYFKNWTAERINWMATTGGLGTPAELTGVTLSVSKADVNVNEEFTLTATATPAGVTGVTYTFYKGSTAIATDVTSNTLKTKLTAEGSAEYTVTAKANGITVTSTAVTVTATKVAQVHDFTVYFKCASAPAYKPYVSLDGATAVAMTQGTELGKNYAGTLTFYWYSYTFNVDSADTHNLTFTSKKTKLNATITDNFANSEYYLAVDNLMTGTEVVDLTGSLEYVRNFFHSATNMVYSGVGTDGTLGFTNIDGERYKMGTVVNTDGTLTFSVKSATTMQMLTAELTTVSETQQALLDVDLDGKVDIKDATLMQRALVS